MIKLEIIQNFKKIRFFSLSIELNKLKILSEFLLELTLGIAFFLIHGFRKFPLPPQKLMDYYFNFSPFYRHLLLYQKFMWFYFDLSLFF